MSERAWKTGVLYRGICLAVLFWTVVLPPLCGGAAPARYLFLFIGDGMGPVQVKLSDAVLPAAESLAMTSFPVVGMATTHALDRRITDSAAAGTALATGSKTSIGTIAMAANHRDTLMTLAEMAKAKGMRSGIVSSVGIDNATPACFYAHNAGRGNYYEIAMQMASSGFDYFAGGYAEGNFAANRMHEGVLRPDIVQRMQRAGYRVTGNRIQLLAVKPGQRCWAYTGYDNHAAMDFSLDHRSGDLELAEFTREGIRLLDNRKGFFMMVEGGKIDWACHSHDAAAAAHDVKAFDDAIRQALAFYRRHASETLIVVTADHETGGLSLGNAATGYDGRLELLRSQSISQQRFAEKVASWKKLRTVSFSMALDSLAIYYGLGRVSADTALRLSTGNRNVLREAYAATMSEGAADTFTGVATGMLNTRAGIGWTTGGHTALPVEVFAVGCGAKAFGGFYDNTDIARKIISIGKLQRAKKGLSRHERKPG